MDLMSDAEVSEMVTDAIALGRPNLDAYVFSAQAWCDTQQELRESDAHIHGMTDRIDTFLGVPVYIGYTREECHKMVAAIKAAGLLVALCMDDPLDQE